MSEGGKKYTDAEMLYMVCLALEEGIDGVRRIDLDDLLVKMIAEHWGTADEDTLPDEAEAAFAQLEPYIPEHIRTATDREDDDQGRAQLVIPDSEDGGADEARVGAATRRLFMDRENHRHDEGCADLYPEYGAPEGGVCKVCGEQVTDREVGSAEQ